jgi:hypothetical protein
MRDGCVKRCAPRGGLASNLQLEDAFGGGRRKRQARRLCHPGNRNPTQVSGRTPNVDIRVHLSRFAGSVVKVWVSQSSPLRKRWLKWGLV